MQYIDFVKNLADDLQEEFEKRNRDVRVEFRKVEKHWGTELGIEIFEKGCSAPIIYPKDLYDRHEAGEEYFSLLDVCADRIENVLDNTPFYRGCDLNVLKDSITLNVINLENGKKYLMDKPYKVVEDLAIIYKLNVDIPEYGKGTIPITLDIMERLGFDQETIHQFAMERSPLNAPCLIQNLTDTIKNFDPDEFFEMPDSPLTLVTNEAKVLGAGVIFYPGVLDKCADVMNGNFYVLPSSTHEVLICKDDGLMDLEELKSMVKEVNDTMVSPEELLSDNVYHYDWKEKVFDLAENHEKRMKSKEKQSLRENLEAKKHDVAMNGQLRRNQDIGSRKIQGGSPCL